MITEQITINEKQFAILHINEPTGKVHRVDVHTPDAIQNINTSHYREGIPKEGALVEVQRLAQESM
jgi:hypothetical protein